MKSTVECNRDITTTWLCNQYSVNGIKTPSVPHPLAWASRWKYEKLRTKLKLKNNQKFITYLVQFFYSSYLIRGCRWCFEEHIIYRQNKKGLCVNLPADISSHWQKVVPIPRFRLFKQCPLPFFWWQDQGLGIYCWNKTEFVYIVQESFEKFEVENDFDH